MKYPRWIDVVCAVACIVLIWLSVGLLGLALDGGPGATICKVLIPILMGLAYLAVELPYLMPILPRKKAKKKPLPVRQHKQGRAERADLKNQHSHYNRRRSA